MPYQQRIVNVTLDYVRFRLILWVRPLADLTYIAEQENSFALTAADLC